MNSGDEHRVLYPDEKDDSLLNEREFLTAVESTISIAKAEIADGEARDLAILFHLGVLCYIQGVQLAVENLKRDGKLNDPSVSRIDRQVLSILCAQTRWEFADTYCRTMLEMTINPVGLLIVLKHIADEQEDDSDGELAQAVDVAAHIIEEKAQGELASVESRSMPENITTITADETLVKEFFDLLEEIGTFYADRDKYETEEQKELHDRVVAAYQQIAK